MQGTSGSQKRNRTGRYKMISSLTVTGRLKQYFHLIPELDTELIGIVVQEPFLRVLIGTDINKVPDPENVYLEITSTLLKYDLKQEEIIETISVYFSGDMWEKWDDGEKELFINEIRDNHQPEEENSKTEPPSKFPITIGKYTIKDDGIYKQIAYKDPNSGEINTFDSLISPTPCFISSIGNNIDSGGILYKLCIKDIMKRDISLWKTPGDLLKKTEVLKLLDEGMHFQEQEAKELINYFDGFILKYKDSLPVEITASTNGWKNNYSLFVIGGKAISANEVKEITQISEELQKNYDTIGNKTEWIENIGAFLDYDLVRLKMYATVGAFLIRFTPIETFLIHNYHESSGGKTLSMRVAASLIGNPNKDGIVQSADNTPAGIELYLETHSDTPVYWDETSDNPDFLQAVYKMGNEKGRGRGTKDLKYRQGGSWKTIAESTGEEPLTKGMTVKTGQQTRIIEVHERIPLLPQDYIDKLRITLSNNYGLFLEEIIQEIFKIRDKIDILYGSVSMQLGEPLNEFAGRKKGYFVVLAMAGMISEDVFRNNGIPRKDAIDICKNYYDKTVLDDPTIPYADRALQNLYQWTVRNPTRFERVIKDYGSDGLAKGAYETYGWITKESIYYDEGILKDTMERIGFNYERVKEDWKKDIIEPEIQTDKKTGKTKIKSYASPTTINGKRIRGIRIKINTLAEKLSMDELIFEIPEIPSYTDSNEMDLKEKCDLFLFENPKYKLVTYTDEDAAFGLIRENDQIEMLHGKEYIIQMMEQCRQGCRSI